jgi:hypothetical protein
MSKRACPGVTAASVHPDRDERPGTDRAAVRRGGDERDLRHRGAGHVAQAHQPAGREPQRLHPGAQFGIRLEVSHRLVPGPAEIGRGHDHDWHAVVYAGDGDPVDDVADVARRQQGAGGRPLRAREVEHHRRGRPGDAGDRGLARVVDDAVRAGEGGGGRAAGVDHVDPDRRLGRQSTLHRERSDAGQQVAAVLPVRDGGCLDAHLQEQVIDVSMSPGRTTDHRHLGGQRMRPADAVDLPGVRAAHDAQQQIIPLGRIRGQVLGQEVRPLRRPAAHQHAPHAVIRAHQRFPPACIRRRARRACPAARIGPGQAGRRPGPCAPARPWPPGPARRPAPL